MKKICTAFVSLILLLSLAFAALASPVTVLNRGQTIDFPQDANLMKIYVLKIFARDCILVQAGGQNMLVDCGGTDYGKLYVEPFLKEIGVDHIDIAVNTHPDEDHIGGFFSLIDLVAVDKFYTCFPEVFCTLQTQFLALAEEKGLPVEWVTEDTDLSFGGISIWTIQDLTNPKKANPCSLVMHLTFGNSTALLLADVTTESMDNFVEIKGEAMRADVVKMPHHGINTPSRTTMECIQPQFAVITHWRHEITNRTVSRLREYKVPMKFSGEGIVEMVTDGESWMVCQR